MPLARNSDACFCIRSCHPIGSSSPTNMLMHIFWTGNARCRHLDVENCAFSKDGLAVTLRRSKTDQNGAGRKIGIPYGSNPETCPVRLLQCWIDQTGITSGPLFRAINRHGQVQAARLSGIDVARVVKKLARRAGLDAAKFAGHSLRAGHATSAAIAGRRNGRS
jgi:hypothetical protein